MNFVEKMKVKKDLKKMIKNNDHVCIILDKLSERYKFNSEEIKSVEDCKKHLSNSSLIFRNMLPKK